MRYSTTLARRRLDGLGTNCRIQMTPIAATHSAGSLDLTAP
jgi:hypothetical protein